MTKVLVAGLGNIFLGDDAFGSEVARRLLARPSITDVVVHDFGIRTMDLLYALEKAELAIIVDVVSRAEPPGTLYVIDALTDASAATGGASHGLRALASHGSSSSDLFQWAAERSARGENPRSLRIIGCEPANLGEDNEGSLGMSGPVERAVERAASLAIDTARQMLRSREVTCTSSG